LAISQAIRQGVSFFKTKNFFSYEKVSRHSMQSASSHISPTGLYPQPDVSKSTLRLRSFFPSSFHDQTQYTYIHDESTNIH